MSKIYLMEKKRKEKKMIVMYEMNDNEIFTV